MIAAEDILCPPCTPDLIQSGIAYACRSLSHSHPGAGPLAYGWLRRTAAATAVELAFRRRLVEQHVPFEVKAALPFTDPDHYVVSFGKRRCAIRTFLISDRQQVPDISLDPGLLLGAPALVPLEQYAAEGQSPEDLYLFAFLLGTTGDELDGERRAVGSKESTYLVHAMPSSWAHPPSWIPLRPLILKAEGSETMELEIGGQDRERENLVSPLILPPRARRELDADFHAVTYLHLKQLPTGRLGLRSSSRREPLIIGPSDWHDIWIEAKGIYLAGWITREQFRQRARLVNEGSRVFQYNRTRVDNLAVDISELKPLDQLFERMRTVAPPWDPPARSEQPDPRVL